MKLIIERKNKRQIKFWIPLCGGVLKCIVFFKTGTKTRRKNVRIVSRCVKEIRKYKRAYGAFELVTIESRKGANIVMTV